MGRGRSCQSCLRRMFDAFAPSPLAGEGWGEVYARSVRSRGTRKSLRTILRITLPYAPRLPLTLTLSRKGRGDQTKTSLGGFDRFARLNGFRPARNRLRRARRSLDL